MGGPKIREFNPRWELIESWNRGEKPNFDLTEHLPGVSPIDSDSLTPEMLLLRYGGRTYILSHSNFLRIPVQAPDLLKALKLTDDLREAFEQANNGLKPEELLFCVWLADFVQTEIMRNYPTIWQQFRMSGFCTYSLKALQTMWLQVAESPGFSSYFPNDLLMNVRKNKRELVDKFIENYSFRPEMESMLSLPGPHKGYFIVQLSRDFVIVDFTNLSSLLQDATWFVIEERRADQMKNRQFEKDLEKFLSSQYGVTRFAFPIGYKFEHEKGQFAEVDVSPVVGDCLIWVECKTGIYSLEVEKGGYKAVRNRWAKIATNNDSWLNQADRAARQVALRKVWKNGKLPDDIKWILPVVCASTVEYIAESVEKYFLTEMIPRICTPEELGEFLQHWDWEKIKGGPFLIKVRESMLRPAVTDIRERGGKTPIAIKVEKKKGLSPNPLDAEEWCKEGFLLLQSEDFQGALACFEASLMLESNEVGAWMGKGITLGILGDAKQGLTYIEKALQLNPNRNDVWITKGAYLSDMGDHRGANVCYDQALQLDPDNAITWMNKGINMSRLEDHGGAIVCLEKALQLDPNEPRIAPKLALARCNYLVEQRDLLGALSCCDEAIRLNSSEANAWHHRGIVLYKLERYDEAITCFDKALQLNWPDPKLAYAWSNKGVAFYKLGNIQEAIICLDKALELDPCNPLYWTNKAGLLQELGEEAEAEKCCKEAERVKLRSEQKR